VNGETATTAPRTANRIARIAWLCAFVLPLLLATLLLGAKATQAASEPPPAAPLALEEAPSFEEDEEFEFEEDDEAEFAQAECEFAEEEADEGEIPQAEADALCAEVPGSAEAGRSTATQCPIRSARAHASLKRKKLKLTIGYTTGTPTKATIQIRGIGTFKRKLGRSGAVRIVKKLGKRQPRRIVVRIKAPSCPSPKVSTTRVG